MSALLFDFATRADYRAMVKREFETIRALHAEYLQDLKKTYVLPKVGDLSRELSVIVGFASTASSAPRVERGSSARTTRNHNNRRFVAS